MVGEGGGGGGGGGGERISQRLRYSGSNARFQPHHEFIQTFK